MSHGPLNTPCISTWLTGTAVKVPGTLLESTALKSQGEHTFQYEFRLGFHAFSKFRMWKKVEKVGNQPLEEREVT